MPGFLDEDFLLDTAQARRLYHEVAAPLPIIDYHCHLPPQAIADDHRFRSLTEIWLAGDHYKWRAMRSNGVGERFCTGDATDREKFDAWAATVPSLLRNPLYHWTHLELRRPFGLTGVLLSPATADRVWDHCTERLARPEFSVRGILRRMQVEIVCTTDDPIDDLAPHRACAADPTCPVRLLPAWRPDRLRQVGDAAAWNAWVDRLAAAADLDIGGFADLLRALERRHAFFHAAGCRLSDHGIDWMPDQPCADAEAGRIVAGLRAGRAPDAAAAERFQARLLHECALLDQRRGWVQQLHLGALRQPNSRRLREVGDATGFDVIGDQCYARPLAAYLDRLDRDRLLPRTILYNLNPRDNEMLAAMIGGFQDGEIAGKVQFGAAWWFLDQMEGMTRHLEALSQLGLLARFVGMLTDSRSFLSYTRHEYFRRLLCRILGRDMAGGLVPDEHDLVAPLVADVCYRNAQRYFPFAVQTATTRS